MNKQRHASGRTVRRWAVGALASLAALLGSSCQSVQVASQVAPHFDQSMGSTFAWDLSMGGRSTETNVPAGELDPRIRRAIGSCLADLGILETDPAQAELWVSYRLAVEQRTRRNDPYFEFAAAERYALGTLTIKLLDVESMDNVWVATGTAELGRTDTVSGPIGAQWAQLPEPLEWPVERMVGAMFESLE